ncbi:Flavin-dependent oxidoreductase, luciferase family (includes alkanesulfonate monooxygenase SsuD and methylene tetrahydromethanopterin reductase) [Lentibacillus persicus]|uniref:Flavin-dependent oxidoreductase, luciferase family (Includes alkanesulfonate monooxygenase SsuD and methylene tetrahydromethanopterin reductase) n=2 Tax=Lentibacillus persicus TaxID=640948 RepID=A0A1I1SAA3_9BACI|nr:Flavin-dependent oxidoreductase, luciferase family (includes alkanesulfonate monooxygenase SsuD and methylene tetrahydromethanopterin reductase) [Lentibacillus persicus]
MEFGMFYVLESPDGDFKRAYDEMLGQIEYAEELGFDSVWLAEHHSTAYGSMANPAVAMAAIAERTKKMKIGTLISVLPLNNPIRIAEDYAMADIISGGRLQFGVGRGYQPTEFKQLGVSMEDTRARFKEELEIITGLWKHKNFSYDGKFYQLDNVTLRPRPIQPEPPIYVASISPETFEIVADMGLNITATPTLGTLEDVKGQLKDARAALIEKGMKPENIDFPVNLQMHVADNAEVAYERTKDYFNWYFKEVGALVPGADGKAPKSYESWDAVAENLSSITFDQMREGGVIHVDGPQKLIEEIEGMQEAFGLKQLSCWHRVGGMSDKLVRESMERMAKDVIPYFKKKEAKQKA